MLSKDAEKLLKDCYTKGKVRIINQGDEAAELEKLGLVKVSRRVAKLTMAGEFAVISPAITISPL